MPEVGSEGLIGPFGTPTGTIDPARVSTDFTANFPSSTAPEGGTWLEKLGPTLGVLGEATSWRTPQLKLAGKETLTILGDVTLVVTAGKGTRAIDIAGQAEIIIEPNSSLRIYVEGDILLAGNGVINANAQPASFQIWGTHEGEVLQDINIVGNGSLKAVVHAPSAEVKIAGNGDVMGAVVAHSITLNGVTEFHYDEALARLGDGQPFGAVRWQSLASEEERAGYRAFLDKID